MYIVVLFSDNRTLEVPAGEALVWAWIGEHALSCAVFRAAGNAIPLSPFDIA